MRMEGFHLSPPRFYGSKEILSKLYSINFMHHMHFYIYNCLASVTFYFRVIESVLLKDTSVGLPFLYCTKQQSPDSRNCFQKYRKIIFKYTHTHQSRCVLCISTSDNESLGWTEVTENKERNKVDYAILYHLLHVTVAYYTSFQ